MAVIAGDLRYKIEVKRLTKVKDEYGATVDTYTTVYTLKAGVKYTNGSKGISNNEIFNSQSIQLTTYYRAIKDTDRILFNNKNYKILFINEIGFREGLQINIELIND